jgi:hypothetical protein
VSYVDGSVGLARLEAVLNLEVPSLAAVGGSLTLRADRLRTVAFPGLLEVGDTLDLGGSGRLDTIALPRLSTVGGPMYFGSLPSLASLKLPSVRTATDFELSGAGSDLDTLQLVDLSTLQTLTGAFSVTSSGGDPVFDVPALQTVQSLTFEDNRFPSIGGFSSLQTVAEDLVVNTNETLVEFVGFDDLTNVGGDVWVIGNPTLESMPGLGQLRTVAGTFKLAENSTFGVLAMDLESVTVLDLSDNRILAVDLPLLTTLSQAFIHDNSGFSCLHLPSLTNVVAESSASSAIFSVYDNGSLPSCQVDTIIAQIQNEDLISTNTQNGSGANCTPTICP